jgi:RNA polymerase sigma factor (TIGR02999 family)
MTAALDFAGLLTAWHAREPGSEEKLFACVYSELRKIAAHQMRRENPGHTLQATALAHEAYLRLSGGDRVFDVGQAHFCAIASRLMRQILVDHSRRRNSAKRGGGNSKRASLLDAFVPSVPDQVDLVELDMALERLRELDPREASVVDLRFFAGLSMPEIAATLGLSIATVERDWAAARAWLQRELSTESSLG